MATDPFTLVYDALWSLVETKLTARKVNYSFDDPHYSPRVMTFNSVDDHQLSLTLVVEGGAAKVSTATNSSLFQMRYTWMFKANDLRINHLFLPKMFLLFCALCNWKDTIGALEWNSKRFAKILNDLQLSSGLQDRTSGPDDDNVIPGWLGVLTHQVDMYFTTSDLKEAS